MDFVRVAVLESLLTSPVGGAEAYAEVAGDGRPRQASGSELKDLGSVNRNSRPGHYWTPCETELRDRNTPEQLSKRGKVFRRCQGPNASKNLLQLSQV